MRALHGSGRTRCWVGPGFSPDIMLKTNWPPGPEVSFSLDASGKSKEIRTSGPKGHRTCPVDVRAKARTYPTASSSAPCKAVLFIEMEHPLIPGQDNSDPCSG